MRTDRELVENFLAGEERAFEDIVKRYLPHLYTFLLQLTRDTAVAEDLAQETFIKVWKNLHRFEKDKNFRTWIFAIAKNTAYDYLRKKKSIPFSFFEENTENPLTTLADDTLLPDELFMRAEAQERVEKALLDLSVALRTLLYLHYREDFALAEVAEILDEPYNTIKSRHSRALRRLKEILLKRLASEEELHT